MTQADAKQKPIKRPKGEGQWALGYREPLNANEQSKKDDNPLTAGEEAERRDRLPRPFLDRDEGGEHHRGEGEGEQRDRVAPARFRRPPSSRRPPKASA